MAQQETLIIKHFGPLREAVIEDVKQFMFFIGESGSGKSTLLKVLALMRHISKQLNLRSYLKHGNVIDKTIGINMGEYLYNGGLNDYVSDKTELYYKKGDCEISYTTKGLKALGKLFLLLNFLWRRFLFCLTNAEVSPRCLPITMTVRLLAFILQKLLRISRKPSNKLKI